MNETLRKVEVTEPNNIGNHNNTPSVLRILKLSNNSALDNYETILMYCTNLLEANEIEPLVNFLMDYIKDIKGYASIEDKIKFDLLCRVINQLVRTETIEELILGKLGISVFQLFAQCIEQGHIVDEDIFSGVMQLLENKKTIHGMCQNPYCNQLSDIFTGVIKQLVDGLGDGGDNVYYKTYTYYILKILFAVKKDAHNFSNENVLGLLEGISYNALLEKIYGTFGLALFDEHGISVEGVLGKNYDNSEQSIYGRDNATYQCITDKYTQMMELWKDGYRENLDEMIENLDLSRPLIDLGPGNGDIIRRMLERWGNKIEIVCVEMSPTMCDHIRTMLKDYPDANVTVIEGDMLDKLPDLIAKYPNCQVTATFSLHNIYELIGNDTRRLIEIFSHLEEGSQITIYDLFRFRGEPHGEGPAKALAKALGPKLEKREALIREWNVGKKIGEQTTLIDVLKVIMAKEWGVDMQGVKDFDRFMMDIKKAGFSTEFTRHRGTSTATIIATKKDTPPVKLPFDYMVGIDEKINELSRLHEEKGLPTFEEMNSFYSKYIEKGTGRSFGEYQDIFEPSFSVLDDLYKMNSVFSYYYWMTHKTHCREDQDWIKTSVSDFQFVCGAKIGFHTSHIVKNTIPTIELEEFMESYKNNAVDSKVITTFFEEKRELFGEELQFGLYRALMNKFSQKKLVILLNSIFLENNYPYVPIDGAMIHLGDQSHIQKLIKLLFARIRMTGKEGIRLRVDCFVPPFMIDFISLIKDISYNEGFGSKEKQIKENFYKKLGIVEGLPSFLKEFIDELLSECFLMIKSLTAEDCSSGLTLMDRGIAERRMKEIILQMGGSQECSRNFSLPEGRDMAYLYRLYGF